MELFFLETYVADVRTVADTSPSFSSIGQEKSTAGAAEGVIQDITDAPEISSDRDSNDDMVSPLDVVLPIHIRTHERRVFIRMRRRPSTRQQQQQQKGKSRR